MSSDPPSPPPAAPLPAALAPDTVLMVPDTVLMVYVTVDTAEHARRIGRILVEEGLAACVNLPPPHHSAYQWQGELVVTEEYALYAKTTAERFEALRARVRSLPGYEVPAIMAFPAVAGDADFLGWVRAQVAQTPAG